MTATPEKQKHVNVTTQFIQFGAGALAGLVNTLILSPLDVVKTRLQAQQLSTSASISSSTATRVLRYSGPLHALRLMLREEGIRSYYRGLSASLCAFVPNWAIYWYTYETFKRKFHNNSHSNSNSNANSNVGIHVLSAVGAGCITAFTTAPFWTLKSRLQVYSNTNSRYKSVIHGFKTIIKEEGISGLYKGLTPTLLGLGHVAIQFPLYEYIKCKLSSNGSKQNKASDILIASSISKIAASAVFYPHEVVRTRIQVDRSVITNGSSELARVGQLFKEILKRDGVKGLYTGFAANLVRTVPACMLTFTSYELAKRFAETQSLRYRQRNEDDANDHDQSEGAGDDDSDKR